MEIYNDTYCVYIHTNKTNGKMYCGQTIRGDNPNRRWQNGIGYLSKNNDGSYKQPLMARAILKYGWENFDHEIIASNLTEEEAKSFEILIINKLHLRDSKFGYNLTDGGEGTKGWSISEETRKKFSDRQKEKVGELAPMYGKHHSQESKDKMSIKHKGQPSVNKGKHLSDETRKKMRKHSMIPVLQFSKDGTFIKRWECAKDVENELNISSAVIGRCRKRKAITAGGYVWRDIGDCVTQDDLLLITKNTSNHVFYNKARKKWAAQIYISGKPRWLGCFKTKEEALQAVEKFKQQSDYDQLVNNSNNDLTNGSSCDNITKQNDSINND